MQALEREVTDLIRRRQVDPQIGSVLLKLAEQNSILHASCKTLATEFGRLAEMMMVHTNLFEQLKDVADKLKQERFDIKVEEIKRGLDE